MASLALAGLGFYSLWMGWPYFHAIVVRDAALTSWLGVSTAPIAGYLTNVSFPGDRAGASGRVATITDTRADNPAAARAEADVLNARARVTAARAVVAAHLKDLDERRAHAAAFASAFGSDLNASVAGAARSLASLEQQIELSRTEAARLKTLFDAGSSSQALLDAAHARLADLEDQAARTQTTLERARTRIHAAERNVYLLEDGGDGNTAARDLLDARLRTVEAQEDLARLREEQRVAEQVLARTRSLDIIGPPGGMVWSLISSPGAPVQPGSEIATWVDCRVMLVDVPVSDVEAALLRKGSIANVVLEGERALRVGRVLLTRGSAGTLGSHDLAAIAKGRGPGVAQVLVTLEPTAADVEACAIGHAAYVDFPDVGVFDLILARLRLRGR